MASNVTKWNWKTDSAPGQAVQGKGLFTRFVGWLNSMFNDAHSWFDYDAMDNAFGSVQNQLTQEHLTGAAQEANEFNASEAQKQRDWQEYMSSTQYQRTVADMKEAGVNPALAMSNGVASSGSGASANSVAPGGVGLSMSDMMQAVLLPLTRKKMIADIKNTDAQTEREKTETELSAARKENIDLINQYYPSMQEATLDELAASIGVKVAEVDKIQLENALTKVKTTIAESEAKYSDRMNAAKAAYEEAKTDESKASAAASYARAAMESFELDYASKYGAKLSSSSMLALGSAICSMLGIDPTDGSSVTGKVLKDVGTVLTEGTQETGRKAAKTTFLQDFKNARNRFINWVNKPKKAPWVK